MFWYTKRVSSSCENTCDQWYQQESLPPNTRTPDNSNLFWFPFKVRFIGSQLKFGFLKFKIAGVFGVLYSPRNDPKSFILITPQSLGLNANSKITWGSFWGSAWKKTGIISGSIWGSYRGWGLFRGLYSTFIQVSFCSKILWFTRSKALSRTISLAFKIGGVYCNCIYWCKFWKLCLLQAVWNHVFTVTLNVTFW